MTNDMSESIDEKERTNQALDIIRNPKGNYDSFTFLSRAVSEYCKDKKETVKKDVARIVAKIIDAAFLDGVIAEHIALVELEKERCSRLRQEQNELENECRNLTNKNHNLRVLLDEVEKAIMAHDGKRIRAAESDPAFYGAKKCFDYIFEKTQNFYTASKAFNCYLLGGKYPEYVPDEPENFLNAKEAINEAVKNAERGRTLRI